MLHYNNLSVYFYNQQCIKETNFSRHSLFPLYIKDRPRTASKTNQIDWHTSDMSLHSFIRSFTQLKLNHLPFKRDRHPGGY